MVQTYHGLAMRLSGLSFSENAARRKVEDMTFDQLIIKATRLLKGELDLPGLAGDEVRDRLLAGFRFILVDEYQDIDEAQYELISALAGRTQPDSDSKLAIIAVGDDDQNIYASFRHTSVRFIRQFQDDYDAKNYNLLENYRSTEHIISAANALIAHNRERMKAGQNIVVNQGRRPLSPGGNWENLDPVARGKVQLCIVPDSARQVVAVVAEVQRLRQLNPALKWDEVAVLARTHEQLASIRALLEEQAIPICWTEDREKFPPLFRIREISTFLDHLRHHRHELANTDLLLEWLGRQHQVQMAGPWVDLLHEILAAWRIESRNTEFHIETARDFICEALIEYRRDPARGRGVYLGTVHGAKGMEFSHVLIPSGGWSTPVEQDRLEEERRVYYVAMTRAKETLCLFDREDAFNPHISLLQGDFLLKRTYGDLVMPDPKVLARRYAVLGMRDINLGFAGLRSPGDPVHRHLSDLQVGDAIRIERQGESVFLLDKHNFCIGKLSKTAGSEWGKKLSGISAIKILAMLQWRPNDGGEGFTQMYRCESWEVPMAEVVYSNQGCL
jgi:ATP-dependent DNA helicase RecQ